ncbi:hypothetical protein Csac_0628 [Caldicellulosiruptor saccharolyticus DSM 8903]|uniref:Uncharacterized protein n=1 Tax=Caldicellulosiruptor saccharolyticus (strain ATCC 43494 / DSM 8903 / Tp8T 6331) TaxID=351627 RepID=A4XH66_CALS8|nr:MULTISPECIES: hypothetical protein [Caldicellulosiruptor]ABP66251.1 hypothetical protein Csac_0628 [Caldicellulosiruptor saccharolyticus DSM 8903]
MINMLFDMGQINRGKEIVNTGIVTLILLLFGDFIINLTSLGINEELIKKIVFNGIVFINILLFTDFLIRRMDYQYWIIENW